MLVNLHVKNLAIIDEVEVDFSDQFNVLTGETGAGKSIIIGSINIALGGKVSKDMIRKGAEFALVELVFSVDTMQQKEKLQDIGISVEEDELLISRKLMGSRNVNRINGETVTLGMIRQVASLLLDIHGQNEQQSLLHIRKHMEIVDRYAKEDMGDLLQKMESGYREYKSLLAEREQGKIPEEERLREISFIQYELDEIAQAHIQPGEEERLTEEYRRLSNASNIAQGLGEVYELTGSGTSTASEQIERSVRILYKVADYDEQIAEYALQLSQIEDLMTDFNRDISSYMDDFDGGEEQFQQVETRLDQVRTIQAKYGTTVEQIQEYAQRQEEKLRQYEEYEEYRQKLEQKIKKQEVSLRACADAITKIRKKNGKVLEKEISRALKELNFLQVQFQIDVRHLVQFTPHGLDEVEFMLSANPGEDMKPIGQAASGGELSRIMLAVKAVLAQHDEIPTLIFDEIDVGISGRTAQKVAEKMAYIGASHQVICISHLAQIGAMADTHYLIEKNNHADHTSTQIRPLDQEESVEELARILGGVQITAAVRQSAQEMKQLADEVKKQIRF